MTQYAQLKSQLKALKLSGVLETLELRIMETQHNQLAFTELLSMIPLCGMKLKPDKTENSNG